MGAMTATSEPGLAYAPLEASSGRPVELSMQRLVLTGKVLPVGARLLVRHDFASAESKSVEVVYCFGLPRDAGLRRFRVAGPGFTARSELMPTREAVEKYERGLERGHLGVLARQYRDGIVNLSVGNLRGGDRVSVWLEIIAGVDLRDDGLRFRFPFTLAPSYHPRARAVAVEQGAGEIELPEEEFGDVLLPSWRSSEEGLHEIGFDLSVDWPGPVAEVSSPSHAIRVRNGAAGPSRVSLAPTGEVPNRDLVLDVRAKDGNPLVLAGDGKDNRRHFAVVVPSTCFGTLGEERPPVVFVLDRSGSMSGSPMKQARKALAACLAALGESDHFGIVAFDNVAESYRAQLAPARRDERRQAQTWLETIDARGGTELVAGVQAAAQMLKGGGGDIFLITDGQVFGSEDILAEARGMSIRMHCLGIGSASQDRFLSLLARETGGVSRFVTPRERVDTEALELFASAASPVAKQVRLDAAGLSESRIEPEPRKLVFAGAPLAVFGECASGESGRFIVEWESGRIEVPIAAAGCSGDTLRLLRGARLITDLESHIQVPPLGGAKARREMDRADHQLEELSRQYGLASRAMALVAVVERAGDRPGAPPETRVVPVGLPQDMAFEGVFPRPKLMATARFGAARQILFGRSAPSGTARFSAAVDNLLDHLAPCATAAGPPEPLYAPPEYPLVDLAALLEADGGMPGSDESERILKTLLALLAFAAEGHTFSSGPFRLHMKRMLEFVESQLPGALSGEQVSAARRVVEEVRAGHSAGQASLEGIVEALIEGARMSWTTLRWIHHGDTEKS